jgi:hypothetical protein
VNNLSAHDRALQRLLAEDPAIKRRYDALVREERAAIGDARKQSERESRREAARAWIGFALETLCAGDVDQHIAAVDLAYDIAHHQEG